MTAETNIISKEEPTSHETYPKFVMGVRVKGQDKSLLCNPGTLKLRVGMQVMVETPQGLKLGKVASNKIINFRKAGNDEVKKIVRVANPQDLTLYRDFENRELKAMALCLDLIKNLKLKMSLSRVVFFPEVNKSVFFFTAEGRIDFRELVKQLASKLRHRIEMRQVGVRDEARAITGMGMCGETLCCSSFLGEFNPVTIRMAKDQGLALNPSKISGVCGRLMCCLQYEHETYRDLIKSMPRVGNIVNTPEGKGKVIKIDILTQNLTVRLEDESVLYYHLDEINLESAKGNSPGAMPS